jgi:undecaprenyl pyrophosphate phosphatase UppP
MLRKLVSLACFLAALLALSVEARLVYYIRTLPSANLPANLFSSTGKWISTTLPECWLAGALAALYYYLIPALRADPEKASQTRPTFQRTWYRFLALGSAQGLALYPGCLTLVQR